jgi:putative flippase GtrA
VNANIDLGHGTPRSSPQKRDWRRASARFLPQQRVVIYAFVGVLNTILYFIMYNALRLALDPIDANSLAVAVCILFSFWANRRFAFAQSGRDLLLRQSLEYAGMFTVTLLISNAALAAVLTLRPGAGLLLENAALIFSSAFLAFARFWFMKGWIFRPGRSRRS